MEPIFKNTVTVTVSDRYTGSILRFYSNNDNNNIIKIYPLNRINMEEPQLYFVILRLRVTRSINQCSDRGCETLVALP